jgi:hypothetical protein
MDKATMLARRTVKSSMKRPKRVGNCLHQKPVKG